VFPEYTWKEPVAQHKPSGYWNSVQNQRRFFEEAAVKLNIKKPDDWYDVSVDTVRKLGGTFINFHYNGSIVRGK
jgi:hypothetical protein